MMDTSCRRELTAEYAEKHQLKDLFAHLIQLVVYFKPDNVRQFLSDEVKRIREERRSTPLFTERDLETMFDLIDATKKHWITVAQLRNTCRNLASATGENNPVDAAAREEAITNAADEKGHVSLPEFKKVLCMLLLMKNVWPAT